MSPLSLHRRARARRASMIIRTGDQLRRDGSMLDTVACRPPRDGCYSGPSTHGNYAGSDRLYREVPVSCAERVRQKRWIDVLRSDEDARPTSIMGTIAVDDPLEPNKQAVMTFYEFNQCLPAEAIELYAGATYSRDP